MSQQPPSILSTRTVVQWPLMIAFGCLCWKGGDLLGTFNERIGVLSTGQKKLQEGQDQIVTQLSELARRVAALEHKMK